MTPPSSRKMTGSRIGGLRARVCYDTTTGVRRGDGWAQRRARVGATDGDDLIESDPAIMMGKPVVRGTRLIVELILDKLAAAETIE
jgi:hypothetical protein